MTFAEFEAQRKANQATTPEAAPEESGSSLLPSALSTLGGVAGEFAGPGGALLGTIIGSAADKTIDPLMKLIKMGPGPMSSEGVGGAMLDSAEGMVGDVAKNTILNKAPGVIAKGLTSGGRALTAAGNSGAALAPAWMRGAAGAVADPILKMLGIPSGVSEAAALAGPPIVRAMGPTMTKVGEAMPSTALSGLRSAINTMKPGMEEPFAPATEADSVRTTVNTARELQDKGMSSKQAGQRAGWPLGKSEEVPYQAPTQAVKAVQRPATSGDYLHSLNPNWHANVTSTMGPSELIPSEGPMPDPFESDLSAELAKLSAKHPTRFRVTNTAGLPYRVE